MSPPQPHSGGVRIALEGCGHGKLNDIYAKVAENAAAKGWPGVDLVIIGGDFQAVRNAHDLSGMSVPMKYREIGDFHEYYSGKRFAPYLTIFIGGNHEASNYLFELSYGGWVAPNIYYLGAANVLRFGPLRIAGLSGIWKGYDYSKPHFERLPYNADDVKTIYHVRELDVRKLMQIRTQVDVGLSHDWPRGVELNGDYERLFRIKMGFREDSEAGRLGNLAARYVLDRLRPPFWFSAHLHVRYTALILHGEYIHPKKSNGAHKKSLRVPQGLDGSSDRAPMSSFGKSNANNEALQAWNQFPSVVAQQDAEDTQSFVQNPLQPGQSHSLDVDSLPCTWRQINPDDPDRNIVAIEENHPAGKPALVKNTDEIDLDLDSDDDGVNSSQTVSKPDKMDVELENKSGTDNAPRQPLTLGTISTGLTEDSEAVAADIREQLPEGFKRQEQSHPPAAVYGPLPDAITNKETQFLALGKCQGNRDCHDFLELLEIHPNIKESGTTSTHPFQLQYDPEWLAITRVFEPEFLVGDPNSQVPPDQGDENYKADIAAAELWVQENIVNKGKLTVPLDFEMTAPEYDPEVPTTTKDMPPEYDNPQTAAFCELLGIPNKFFLTPEEREARMNVGPRPMRADNFQRPPRQGRGGGHRGHRGGRGRGRGRGGYRNRQGMPF